MGEIITTYKIAVINRILNFRRIIYIDAPSYLEAVSQAKVRIPGFREVESCIPVCIVHLQDNEKDSDPSAKS